MHAGEEGVSGAHLSYLLATSESAAMYHLSAISAPEAVLLVIAWPSCTNALMVEGVLQQGM